MSLQPTTHTCEDCGKPFTCKDQAAPQGCECPDHCPPCLEGFWEGAVEADKEAEARHGWRLMDYFFVLLLVPVSLLGM